MNPLLIAVPALLVCYLLFRHFRLNSKPRLMKVDFSKGVNSHTLVVTLHATNCTAWDMRHVNAITRQSLGEQADILSPTCYSGYIANTSVTRLAQLLEDLVEQYWDEKLQQDGVPYQRVILIGHSMGALLARKIYLYGRGHSVDYPQGAAQNNKSEWASHVERIILLAGINRGWWAGSYGQAALYAMPVLRFVTFVCGTSRLMKSFERGAPFVTNLRLEWTRLARTATLPRVVQLLGDHDRTSPEEDHKELMAAPGFIFIPVSNATHADIICMDTTATDPLMRMKVSRFREALCSPGAELEQKYGSNRRFLDQTDPQRLQIEHVVFVMHGIRDFGEWMNRLRDKIEQADGNSRALTSKYGHFPIIKFLLHISREEKVRWFVDQYCEAVALYPNASRISFIGHSNGTYLLASALENYHAVRFDKVYFAGSVVRCDFPWDQYVNSHQIGVVRNDLASHDLIVAWFPKFYQQVRSFLRLPARGFFNLGAAGFDGFQANAGNRLQGMLSGGHGAGVASGNFDSIIAFVLRGSTEVPALASESSKFIRTLSNMSLLVWLFLIVVLVAIGLGLMLLAAMTGGVVTTLTLLLIYLGVLLYLLHTF